MSKLRSNQEEINNSILTLMCLTFNKKEMKRLVEAYILINDITNDMENLKNNKEQISIMLDEKVISTITKNK